MKKYLHSMDIINPNHKITTIESPYKVWILDDFLLPEVPEKILAEWPKHDDPRWFHGIKEVDGEKNILEQGMHAISSYDKIPPFTTEVLQYFHSKEFTEVLKQITGNDGLEPDETFRWSGLRRMEKGAYQLIHSDARKNPINGKRKELTVLFYLNKDYDRARDEGCLEIWDDEMTACKEKVEPKYNRMVIFTCSDTSYHGVPLVQGERELLTFSVVCDKPATERYRALFVPRPTDPQEVREIGLKRSVISTTKY